MRILLTGATGFIGQHLLEALPNALEIRLDPQFSTSPRAGTAGRTSAAARTPAERFADYCTSAAVDDPRLNRLFDELHDELSSGRG